MYSKRKEKYMYSIWLQVSSFGEATVGDFNDDTECLIRIDQSKTNK